MEFTEEMLDAIEAVKGKRKAGLWDYRCETYFKNMQETVQKPLKKPLKKTVKEESTS